MLFFTMKNLNQIYNAYQKSSGVSIDSRSIKKGNLFFALKGPNFDGNKFAKAALESGASYAVIDDPNFNEIDGALEIDQITAKIDTCLI